MDENCKKYFRNNHPFFCKHKDLENKRLNILILSWRGPGHPNAGGAEISTHEHAKGWIREGHNVMLFTAFYEGARREEIIDGVSVVRCGRQFLGVQWEAFKWYLFGKHTRFDLVIDQFHGIPFFTPLFVRAKKLAFIHEVTKEVWKLNQFPVPVNFIVSGLGPIAEPLIFQLYRKIPFMTVSQSTKEDLTRWGIPSGNITIIHNGVNVSYPEKLSQKERKKTLIYLGALAKDKGTEEAINIFSLLSKGWQFWIVGKSDTRYLKELQLLAKNLQLDDRIKFWGYVDERKKYELLGRAHLLINPSVREGWGLVVIEAARMGTPTAAFNVAGLRDSVQDGKTGILCDSVSEMAFEIDNLLKNREKYNKICKEAKIWSKNFSWDKASKESLNLINKFVASQ